MSLHLHNLRPAQGSVRRKKRLGRGNASGRGNYSTRGIKGQKARSGVSGLKVLGMKASMQRIPKHPGFRSLKAKLAIVNLSDIDRVFKSGDVVTPKKLMDTRLIKSTASGV